MKIFLLSVFLFFSIQLQAQYQFMFLNTNPDKKVLPDSIVQQHQKYHMANMEKLANEGFLLVAGPFYEKGGIFIFDPSKGDLYENLKGDSAVMNDRFLLEILEYKPVIGGICPLKDGYEMVTYQFARFHPFSGSLVNKTDPIQTYEIEMLKKELEIVTYAKFGERGGGILIYKSEEKAPILKALKGVKEYGFRLEEKKLYIAEGSFCEKF